MGGRDADRKALQYIEAVRKAHQHLSLILEVDLSDALKLVISGDEVLEVPREALELLADALNDLGNGVKVTVAPSQLELTTEQTAHLLRVSRPHVTSLIDNNDLPGHMAGSHRRVRLGDAMKYFRVLDARRRTKLAELTA